LVRIEDVYLGEVGGVGEREVCCTYWSGGSIVEVGDLINEEAQLAGFRAVESIK
jgi:hypothetical protein